MDNALFQVDPGLFIWALVVFSIVLLILKRYAWKPLLDFLDEREKDISNSLAMAESAKADLEKIKDESEKILDKAKKQGKTIVGDSKQKAEQSANNILNKAQEKSNEFLVEPNLRLILRKREQLKK